jgi:Zn-dependent membrane protease YugP
MPFSFWDPTMVLIIPAVILAFWAQMRVKSTYNKYTKISSVQGMSGAKVAQAILNQNGIHDVQVNEVQGTLSDHYDPRTKVVNLSSENYRGNSLAALAVAAHEVGHAIQHAKGYVPLQIRHQVLPVTSFSSMAAFPLFILGMFMNTPFLMDIGIVLFAAVVLFHMVTLPVEFNASSRALAQLSSNGMLVQQELQGAKKVLNAAALTYVAASAMALLQLIRLIILRGDE